MKQEVLIPAYYNEFKCIGSACEDTCCAGWKVSVDKKSFNKYRKITSGPLAQELKANITRERRTPSDLAYGKIKMDSEGRCTLLREDGLCKIHSELGEEYLCHTCTIYPRHHNQVDERMEKSLGVSCPEAARLVLLNPNGIEFLVEEEDVKKIQTNQTPDYFWDIRMFAIELLQSRNASMDERLIVLGMFLEKVDALSKSEKNEKIPVLMNRYRQLLDDQNQLEMIKELPNNLSFQMDLVRKLIILRQSLGLSNTRYVECLNDLINGLKLNDGSAIEHSLHLYQNATAHYYEPFMKDHHYILENYVVNSLFKSVFPKNTVNLFEQYADLIIHYLLVKLHLIGISATHEGLTIDLAIKCIQSFSKTFEHNTKFFVDVLNELKENSNLTMAHMTVLLKS